MLITNQRKILYNESTAGLLSINGSPLGWIIEDVERDIKTPKITGISEGAYKLGIEENLTPLTLKHLKSAPYKYWFERHIKVLNVPNFQNIYFHIGNSSVDTDGCQVGGYKLGFVNNTLFAFESAKMIKEFYLIVYPRLLAGEEIPYIITNEYK